MKITKKNGNIVMFDDVKVTNSILKANGDTDKETLTEKQAAYLSSLVRNRLNREHDLLTTDDIRSYVAAALTEKGFPDTAEKYLSFKK